MRFKLLFSLFILLFSRIFAQGPEKPPPIAVKIDSVVDAHSDYVLTDSLIRRNPVTENVVFPKKLAPHFRNKYQGEEYNYTTIKPRESLWEKIRRRLGKIIHAIFGDRLPLKSEELIEVFFRILAIIIVGAVVYFLLSYLISKDGNFIFGKKNRKININDSDLKENIHEINFTESISNYERQKDFRFAVRYQFLYILKKLSDKKIIDWNPEKTNKDYVAEYSVAASKDEFRELSQIFDYVWYGEFDIDAQRYAQFKTKFDNFKI